MYYLYYLYYSYIIIIYKNSKIYKSFWVLRVKAVQMVQNRPKPTLTRGFTCTILCTLFGFVLILKRYFFRTV